MSAGCGGGRCVVSVTPGLRLHVWQIDRSMHCSVLGTCLSLSDLHAIARRARWHLDAKASAYLVHSWFVDYMAHANTLSRLVDKVLEKRHAGAAMAIRRARTVEDIEARWREVAGRGQIASAYWMAMSHPLATKELRMKLFGEIHMLSHILGASRREDVSRLHDLENANAALDQSLVQLKQIHRAVVAEKKAADDELLERRRDLLRSERRLAGAHARIAELESETLAVELAARVAQLEGRAEAAEARARAAESGLAAAQIALEDAHTAEAAAAQRADDLAAENEALEHELTRSVVCPLLEAQRAEGGLDGKRILCVGGRSNLVQHYRAIVERRGGEFLHHDGGVEESLDAVTRSLATVDAVFCPVDCVSHAAWFKVKRACKHMAKQLVVLRSSGLSSFARGIQELAAPVTDAAPSAGNNA